MPHRALLLTACLLVAGSSPQAGPKAPPPDGPVTFEDHVRPLLKAHCFECHGESKKLRAGLDLRLRRLLVEGGDSGPAVVPGKPADSLLYQRVLHHEMPPGKSKLSKKDIALLARWIEGGARTARAEPKTITPGLYITEEERSFWAFQPIRRPPSPLPLSPSEGERGRGEGAVAAVKETARVRTPIDAFLLAKLEAKGLSFSPEADRATLIRRASLDLLGLPPSPEEVAHFLADTRPGAYERLIDRLLASPHYGERWGRHWLDVAGYADSEGYTPDDPVRPSAWRYRDYVIRAFNSDMPLDRFIQEQLAGDEMVRPPYEQLGPQGVEKLIATGFLRMAPDGTGSKDVDQGQARNQIVADSLQIVSTSLLGLTMHCAQCHNHRYDPIPQTDYYRLRAVFEPALDWKNWKAPAAREVALLSAADRQKAQQIESEAAKIDQERLKTQAEHIERTFEKELAKLAPELREPVRRARDTPPARRSAAQQKMLRDHPSVNVTAGSLYLYDSKAAADLKAYQARAAKLRAGKPAPQLIRALTEVPGQVPATYLFHRGEHEQPGEAVTPGGLTILEPLGLGTFAAKDPSLPTTGRRLALARELTSGKHPLVARVLVNRVWLHHFGRGIVGTPSDFGKLGERPTHPELLDWLASEFMEGGWRLKRLHRLIMTSTAYRQASGLRIADRGLRIERPSANPQSAIRNPQLVDPDNRLLGRMAVRRLEAEALRDSMLAVSGKLNLRAFGLPVPVTQDVFGQVVVGVDTRDGAGRFTGKEVPLKGEEFRRSVYVEVRRSRPLSVLETFDAPAMSPNCEVRNFSTATPQALLMMNSPLVLELARHFAERVRRKAGDDAQAQVVGAWRLAFGCEPSGKEINEAVAFLAAQAETFRQQRQAPGQPEPRMQALANFCQALLSANRFLYVD
ncbi:MAG: PSD1 and planctomycete cytochrome C domain-containing protein [Gemmataceae bacterium]|nr:PSD1 and planctomycete cytochrome C domain-containing protein [Gemmataceae bacterium]